MRYGSFKYGSGVKYGSSPLTTQLWAVQIDWDGDGIFDGYNDARNMTDLMITRGRVSPVSTSGGGIQMVDTGRLTIELDNTDGRYNPYNRASPIYPYVRPGIRIKVQTMVMPKKPKSPTPVIYPVFAGRIDDILPISGSYDRVKITALDGLEWLDGASADLAIQQNKKPEALIQAVLDRIAWPWGTKLDVSTDVVPWFWWPTGRNALEVIGDLASSYLGVFYVAANGDAAYYARGHAFDQADARLDQTQLGQEVQFQVPWEVVRNLASVTCHPRVAGTTTVLWSLYDKPLIQPGATYNARGNFMSNGQETPAAAYTTPVAGTDFKVNTLADGSGTDITANCSATVTVYGTIVYYTVTNNGATPGYLILCQFRGQPLETIPVNKVSTDVTSQALYGPRQFTLDSDVLQNVDLAAALADNIIQTQAYPQYYPTVTITARPDLQFAVDLFDFVDLVIDKLGISSTYQLGYIEHRWTSTTGQQTESIFGFEPVNNVLTTVWMFTTQIGVTSIFSF